MSESKFSAQLDGSEITKLFCHTKKPEWGAGLILKEEEGKVAIQFEDGKARTFSEDFYHFIEETQKPADEMQSVIAELQRLAPSDAASTKSGGKKSGVGRKSSVPPVVFKEQAEHFLELFPAGFGSERYKESHRARATGSQLKKHRDEFIKKAQEAFTPEAFTGDVTLLFKTATKLVNSTDLLSSKERKAFDAIQPINHEKILESLLSLLHGEGSIENRMDAFVLAVRRGLGDYPSWGLVTYFLGLVHPNEYPIVTRDTYRKQAAAIAPRLEIPKRPKGADYRKIIDMIEDLRKAMSQHPALKPTDLLDVQNFIALTLKPKGRKAILEKREGSTATAS